MNTALSQEHLTELLDTAFRDVAAKTTGVQLYSGTAPPGQACCTVHIAFKKGFHSSLALCTDTALLARMTRYALRREDVPPQDLEDFGKEFLNVLCGRIAAALFRATKTPSRFSVPAFYRGRYAPEGQREQFVIQYASDRRECAQLIHYIPLTDPSSENE